LGCATFGREIDEAASRAVLDHASAHGFRHFDTAAAYGAGASEAILGRWLADRRPAGAEVVTKLVPPYDSASLSAGLAGSLQRLGVACVDVFYLHRWDASLTDDSLRALEEARQAGRFGRLGISNIQPDSLRSLLGRQRALGLRPCEVLQCNQNFAVTELTPEMRGVCAEFGLEVVTFSPLGAGFLTGKHRAGVVPGSRFDLVPGHQAIYFNPAARQRLELLLRVAERTGHAPEHLALAWALRRPGVSTVLVGARSAAHLDQALAARDLADTSTLAALASE
jgi:aryl-alcohol dehydrogenase-like predicted oxidoreductase